VRPAGATGAETRRRVEGAALRLFAAQGFAATGIRQLAREAGITSAALYGYMATKEDLLLALMRGLMEPLLEESRVIAARAEPAVARLRALAIRHVTLHGEHPLAARVADTELRALAGDALAGMLALRDAYEALWVAVIDDGVLEGTFATADTRITAIALIDLCGGVSDWYQPDGRHSLARIAAMHADLCIAAIRMPPT
jgi:AcrR family transcriptional regulator